MTNVTDFAEKILTLIDEYPSEVFSFERKQIIPKIEALLYKFSGYVESEVDEAFRLGREEGEENAESRYKTTIDELQQDIRQLESENRSSYEEGFAAGVESLRDFI